MCLFVCNSFSRPFRNRWGYPLAKSFFLPREGFNTKIYLIGALINQIISNEKGKTMNQRRADRADAGLTSKTWRRSPAAAYSRDVMFDCGVTMRVIQSKQKYLEMKFYQQRGFISLISVSILVIDLILNTLGSLLTKLRKKKQL